MNPEIKILGKELKKSYRKQKNQTQEEVFSNLNLSIQTGNFVAIRGPSGCGKSTLLNLLSALDTPDSGEVWIDGQEISRFSDRKLAAFRRSHLGFVFQSHLLIDELTVLENIILPLRLQGVQTNERKRQGEAMLQRVGLQNKKTEYPHELSIGQQQRAGIARALIHRPSLVFADEPTGNLDGDNTTQVMRLFRELQKEHSTTIVMVTHTPHLTCDVDKVLQFSCVNGKTVLVSEDSSSEAKK